MAGKQMKQKSRKIIREVVFKTRNSNCSSKDDKPDLEKTVLQKGKKWAATLYGMYNATVYGVWYSYTTAQANPDPD